MRLRIRYRSGFLEICYWCIVMIFSMPITYQSQKTTNVTTINSFVIRIKQKCKKTWTEIIELTRHRLYEVYCDLLNQFNSQEVSEKQPLFSSAEQQKSPITSLFRWCARTRVLWICSSATFKNSLSLQSGKTGVWKQALTLSANAWSSPNVS